MASAISFLRMASRRALRSRFLASAIVISLPSLSSICDARMSHSSGFTILLLCLPAPSALGTHVSLALGSGPRVVYRLPGALGTKF